MRRAEKYLVTVLVSYWVFASLVILGFLVADHRVLFGAFVVSALLPLLSPYIARSLDTRPLAWDFVCGLARRLMGGPGCSPM